MDKITARGLRFTAVHGCLPEERAQAQEFIVNVNLFLDLAEAASTDDLNHTVDYSQAYDIIAAVMSGPPRNLIESLAGAIGQALLDAFPRLEAVETEVRKPAAPVKGQFEYFSVTVRSQQNPPPFSVYFPMTPP